MRTLIFRLSAAILGASAIAACDSDPASVSPDVLQGLQEVTVSDTTTPAPVPAAGSFHGMILGYWTGADSVNVPLGNVRVSAYVRVDGGTSNTVAAESFSDASGHWELPVLAAGEYAVVYEPGTSSAYRGGYTIATTSAQSAFWTVMLAKK